MTANVRPYESLEKYRPEMLDTMKGAFKAGASITKVCCLLDISRETYYRWKNENQEFSLAASKGEQHAQAHWEDIGEDGIVGELEKFNGASWQFVMKNRFKEQYSDSHKDQQHSAVEMLLNMLVEKNK